MPVKTLIVLGGGPGGYAAALDAAQKGISITLVDPQPLGGACLHRGCIPSKFFLSKAKHATEPVAQIEKLILQKEAVLTTLSQRMEQAAKSARIERIVGSGKLVSANEVEIEGVGRRKADAIVLATGSSPLYPSAFPKHAAIFTSDTIFNINYLPAHLVVLGGGYIGAELACAFQGLGSKVTLIEKEASLLSTQSEFSSAAPVLTRALQKRGITIHTGTEVKTVSAVADRKLLIQCSNGETIEANALLLALGRRPNLDALNLAAAGITLTDSRLTVNVHNQTSVPSIYAIGDLVSPLPLAHTASKEAELAVAHMAGETTEKLSYTSIPRVVYTSPEIAAVGLSEAQAKAAGHAARIDRFHFAGSSKAMVEGDTEGFWMILSDTATKKILGAMIVGPQATELIHLVALAIYGGLTTTQVANTVFAHPTLSEGFMEAMKRSVNRPTSDVRRPQS